MLNIQRENLSAIIIIRSYSKIYIRVFIKLYLNRQMDSICIQEGYWETEFTEVPKPLQGKRYRADQTQAKQLIFYIIIQGSNWVGDFE